MSLTQNGAVICIFNDAVVVLGGDTVVGGLCPVSLVDPQPPTLTTCGLSVRIARIQLQVGVGKHQTGLMVLKAKL